TLSIRVGGEDHLTCVARRALELRERLLLALDCHVLGLEALLHVYAQLLGREIEHMAHGSLDSIVAAEVLADGAGLGGRLDYHERGLTRRCGRQLILCYRCSSPPRTRLGRRALSSRLPGGLLRGRLLCCLLRGHALMYGRKFRVLCSTRPKTRAVQKCANVLERDASVVLR